MKKVFVLCGLFLATAVGLSALNEQRVIFWEQTLSVYMDTNDKESLLGFEKALTTKQPQDDADKVKLGLVYHNLSRVMVLQGVRGNAKKAADLFQSVLNGKTEEELKLIALSYYGSALALQGSEDQNPIAKIGFVNQGMDKLNEGVTKYAKFSWVPYLIRANVALSLPDFFNKLDVAGSDLKALETASAQNPERCPKSVQALVENLLGNYLKKKNKIDDAVAAWKKSVALDPEKKGAGKAAAKSLDVYAD